MSPLPRSFLFALAWSMALSSAALTPANAQLPNPILFVTQMPIPEDGGTIGSIFANHMTDTFRVGRGGDLYLLYPDGTLRNLTQEAGFGNAGFQGESSIAVRNPVVHFSGTKALFSMVIGAPAGPEPGQMSETTWQLYEVSGLGQGETAVIVLVPHQPPDTNNVDPVYGSDGRIIFVSDLPIDGQFQLYPQLDEYDAFPTTTGLWSLDPITGDLGMLNHAPSGLFSPRLDSFGRIVFTRWDHLTRDKQALDDSNGADFGTFNWSDESPEAVPLDTRVEVFPEPLFEDEAALAGTNLWATISTASFPGRSTRTAPRKKPSPTSAATSCLSSFRRCLTTTRRCSRWTAWTAHASTPTRSRTWSRSVRARSAPAPTSGSIASTTAPTPRGGSSR